MNARAERALRDMRTSARLAITYAASYPHWPEEQMVMDAIAKRVEQVADVAKYRFPFELRRTVPGIEWDDIASMRDRLVHDYDRLNLRILQAVLVDDLPALIRTIDLLLPDSAEK